MTALAAVLAGGRGRRMGGAAKPCVELGGRPLVAWPVAAAARAGLETVIVAKRSTPLPDVGVPVWHEPDDPTHPLTGVVAALERAGRPVLAIPCDMPFLTPALLARLAAGPEAAVAGAPFPARFEPSALPALRAAAAAGDPVRAALAALAPQTLAVADPQVVASINTPDELAAAAALLRAGGATVSPGRDTLGPDPDTARPGPDTVGPGPEAAGAARRDAAR